MRVTRDIESPPGGWEYTVPETGLTIKAPFAKILKGRVKAHLEANVIPVPEPWDVWFEDALCRQSQKGPPWCGKDTPKPIAGMPHMDLNVAARFIKTMAGVIRERKFVTTEEALRRNAICMACPLAIGIGGCRPCHSVFKMADKLFPDNPIPVIPDKEFCGACGCRISWKAHIPNHILDKAEGSNRPPYAEGCWRNEG